VKSDLFPDVPFSWNPLKFQELEERVRSTREATICALNQMLDLKDLNTGVHSTRLAEWAVRVGQELGMEESGLADIEVAALLHDAGKVGVPDAILKKPGPLDPAEWRVMRMHPEFSWAVLRLVPGLEKASLYATVGPAAVPEPPAFALLTTALAGLFLFRLRTNRRDGQLRLQHPETA